MRNTWMFVLLILPASGCSSQSDESKAVMKALNQEDDQLAPSFAALNRGKMSHVEYFTAHILILKNLDLTDCPIDYRNFNQKDIALMQKWLALAMKYESTLPNHKQWKVFMAADLTNPKTEMEKEIGEVVMEDETLSKLRNSIAAKFGITRSEHSNKWICGN